MRRSILLSSLLMFVMLSACKDLGEEPRTLDIIGGTGIVIEQSVQFYIIQSDFPLQIGVRTFYPMNLPDTFRKNGLRVRFSGRVEIDPTAQYLYCPLRLSSIESWPF
jgi:hypothetical protein